MWMDVGNQHPEEGLGEWLDQLLINDFHTAGLYLPEEREEMERQTELWKNNWQWAEVRQRALYLPLGQMVGQFGAHCALPPHPHRALSLGAIAVGFLPGIGVLAKGAAGAIGGLLGQPKP